MDLSLPLHVSSAPDDQGRCEQKAYRSHECRRRNDRLHEHPGMSPGLVARLCVDYGVKLPGARHSFELVLTAVLKGNP
jgi:hypothetical protein